MSSSLQSCIAGFAIAFTDYCEMVCADRMHIDTGIFHHIWTIIKDTHSPADVHVISAYIKSCSTNTLLPKQHIEMTQAGKVNSCEATSDWVKLVPVALLLLPDSSQLIKLVSGMTCLAVADLQLSVLHRQQTVYIFI